MARPLVRSLGIAASLLATCQGLTWSVLSFMGILIYAQAWTPVLENLTEIQFWIYNIFLNRDISNSGELMMVGNTMLGFMSVYLALSFIWMIVSLTMLWVVVRQKWDYSKCTFITWGSLTIIISIIDIVAMSLFIVDFIELRNIYELILENFGVASYSMVSAGGVMMTIAARGFALLIANIIFAILYLVWGCVGIAEDQKDEPKREFINGFQQSQRPAWLANGDRNSGLGRPYSNPGYENEQPQQPKLNSINRNQYTPPPQPDNFARFGRNNLKPYQHQQSQDRGPYIPAPDYSPPSLQKHPKSVLKSRSNY